MRDQRFVFSRRQQNLYCFADSIELCDILLSAGARIIQLREKHLSDDAFYELATKMQRRMRRYPDSAFIINDRVHVALALQADGVHVGQEDADIREVVQQAPEQMVVGVSVDTLEQALVAQKAGATYVGAGSIFPTATKLDAVCIGLQGLRRIVQGTRLPVVAIGGIALDNIHQVAQAGAHYYAVISQINQAADIPARLNAFLSVIGTEMLS